jgi:hypothetical protein
MEFFLGSVRLFSQVSTPSSNVSPDALVDAGNLTEATVGPQLTAIKTALDVAATALGALSVVPELPLARRQSTDDVAKLVAGIITVSFVYHLCLTSHVS